MNEIPGAAGNNEALVGFGLIDKILSVTLS